MSEAEMSTSTSRLRTAVVPLIAAPIRYGATNTFHLSSTGGCAAADVAAPATITATTAKSPMFRFTHDLKKNRRPDHGRRRDARTVAM